MVWIILLYAVGTHQLLPSPVARYDTEQECRADAKAMTNELAYAVCRKIDLNAG